MENLTDLFEEMTTSLTKVTPSYENILVMGDFNIDIKPVSETGLSDYHKMITTFFKLCFFRIRPKVKTYRNYK